MYVRVCAISESISTSPSTLKEVIFFRVNYTTSLQGRRRWKIEKYTQLIFFSLIYGARYALNVLTRAEFGISQNMYTIISWGFLTSGSSSSVNLVVCGGPSIIVVVVE